MKTKLQEGRRWTVSTVPCTRCEETFSSRKELDKHCFQEHAETMECRVHADAAGRSRELERKGIFLFLSILLLAALPLYASRANQVERLENSADVLSEIMKVPEDSIPKDLLNKAECVVIIPGAKKAAFGIGGTYGKGCMICRQEQGWSPPVMMQLTGGSYGLQIGGVETDYVLLIMNERGMEKLLQSKVTLGGDASIAGGPKGRTVAAATDVQMRAEILSYARSRGAFAGVSLGGAVLKPDGDDNEDLYGVRIRPQRILTRGQAIPTEADRLISLLNVYSP